MVWPALEHYREATAVPARTLNLVLALWLFVSAFVWPRTSASFANAWLVGLLSAALAVVAMRSRVARFGNTFLSAWLLVSAFVLPRRSALAFWNDLGVAALMLAISLVPGTMYAGTRRRAPA